MPSNSLLCPKEVATALSVSERTALRLMTSGEIQSMRCGPKLWRTTRANVAAYQYAQMALAHEGPQVRAMLHTIACLRELDRLQQLTASQAASLDELERALSDRHVGSAITLVA